MFIQPPLIMNLEETVSRPCDRSGLSYLGFVYRSVRKWKLSGVSPSPIDIDITNECLLPLWQALPPRVAANLAVSSAKEIDRALEDAPSDLISEIEKLGERYRLYRSEHRKLHLDEIEEVLKLQGTSDPQ